MTFTNGNRIKRLLLSQNKNKRLQTFRRLPRHTQSFLLLDLPPRKVRQLLVTLPVEELVTMLNVLDPDQVTDVLQHLEGTKKKERILSLLKANIKDKVQFLLRFHPGTAAGIMDINYIEVPATSSFSQVIKALARREKTTGKAPTVLVLDEKGFVGGLATGQILTRRSSQKIANYIKTLPTVHYREDKDQVIDIFQTSPHDKVVVLDDDESILGVIYSDDIIRLLRLEESKTMYDFAGVQDEEDVFDSMQAKVQHRYKWLILNLATAFLAAGVVSLFTDTINKFVLLAVYMPIVSGMGGNAATQTLAVMVRGIALGEVNLANSWPVLWREVGAGLINGVINGILVALIAFWWNGSPLLGLVIALAMVINLFVAGLFGAIIPLLLSRWGKDPAASATVFITTATDVFGFLAFLGLASLILP